MRQGVNDKGVMASVSENRNPQYAMGRLRARYETGASDKSQVATVPQDGEAVPANLIGVPKPVARQ